MKRTTLSNHIEAFKTEALMLLRFQLAFNRIRNFKDFKNISRSDYVDKLISLKSIENDLLIRICKFDDMRKGVHSFKRAELEISKNHSNRTELLESIKKFSGLVSKIKNERRHKQLAHLKIGIEDNEYEIRFDFVPVIHLIVKIIDLMNLSEINYEWSDGKYEKFDLRKEILNNN